MRELRVSANTTSFAAGVWRVTDDDPDARLLVDAGLAYWLDDRPTKKSGKAEKPELDITESSLEPETQTEGEN